MVDEKKGGDVVIMPSRTKKTISTGRPAHASLLNHLVRSVMEVADGVVTDVETEGGDPGVPGYFTCRLNVNGERVRVCMITARSPANDETPAPRKS